MVTLLCSRLRTDIILATLRTWSWEEAEKNGVTTTWTFDALSPCVGCHFTFCDAVADSFSPSVLSFCSIPSTFLYPKFHLKSTSFKFLVIDSVQE